MIIVAILNAGRNSFSFFLLLIVCMGYGVVKPSLGKTMIRVRWLAAAHFVFGLIYSIASLTITPDSAGNHVSYDAPSSIADRFRPACAVRHSSTRRNLNCILCMDFELSQLHNERSQ